MSQIKILGGLPSSLLVTNCKYSLFTKQFEGNMRQVFTEQIAIKQVLEHIDGTEDDQFTLFCMTVNNGSYVGTN